MLVLARKVGESVVISDDVTVTVVGVSGNHVRLGINATREIEVHREEIYKKIQMEKTTRIGLEPTREAHSSPIAGGPSGERELSVGEARSLLGRLDDGSVVGLRDLALVGLLSHTFVPVNEAVALTVEDYCHDGNSSRLRISRVNDQVYELPVPDTLDAYLRAYLDAAGIADDTSSPLFRTIRDNAGKLSERAMTHGEVYRMIQRRGAEAGLAVPISCRVLRGSCITVDRDVDRAPDQTCECLSVGLDPGIAKM